ncbi:hypothetical protein CIHG_08796 [Coccidioides immitis H538.4]|uniref:Uncharacterized protein n=3 Tax=Coccidioides immitis TaxID=5501 RepID=A0A0J8QZQ5_COCIT|nr:hypothetical protein CISG_01293 [Coccidioides immitis RMSCC 3703]KMU90940.1 hypothetical protein CIHG_08796 [Coccidioides immitis H538.4]
MESPGLGSVAGSGVALRRKTQLRSPRHPYACIRWWSKRNPLCFILLLVSQASTPRWLASSLDADHRGPPATLFLGVKLLGAASEAWTEDEAVSLANELA